MIDTHAILYWIDRAFAALGIWVVLMAIVYFTISPDVITPKSCALIAMLAVLIEHAIAMEIYEIEGDE